MARWASGCVVDIAFGGVGGRRILSITPEPAQWSAFSDMVRDHRDVRDLPIESHDATGGAGDTVAQRSKSLSVGGGGWPGVNVELEVHS